MRGFGLFFKILKSNIVAVSAYLLILVLSSFIFGLTNETIKTRQMVIAPVFYVEVSDELINNLPSDESKTFDYLLENNLILKETDDVLSKALVDYSKEYLHTIDLDAKHVNDAAYTSLIHGVLIIPSNLSNLDRNSTWYLFHARLKDSSQIAPLHSAISKYLNVYHSLSEMYIETNTSFIKTELINKVDETLTNQATLDLSNPVDLKVKLMSFFFDFSTYILSANIIMIVCMIIFEIKRTEVFRRIATSPYNKTKFIIEILLAAILTGILLVGFVFLMSILTNAKTTLTKTGLYFLLNLLLYVLPITSLSVFLGLAISKQEIVSMLSTVLSLAQAFFTGAFVPTEVLSNTIITLGKIFPSAYTIKINSLLLEQSSYNMGEILLNGGILIAYSLLFIGLSLVFYKKRVTKE